MKFRFLILLLFCSGTANSDDGKEPSVDSQDQKKGDTIWLEEKISPTTTWIENLVKPLTEWMEQQIQEPEQEVDGQEIDSQESEEKIILEPIAKKPDNAAEAASIISSEQAEVLAKNHIAGDVLYIKLVSKTNQYRVKLISKLGEVHIIYIKAVSGEIVLPNDKVSIKPVKQISAEQDNQTNSESDGENREKP